MRMHRRAVDGIRRLLALAEAPDPDVVREALLSELTTALPLDSVTVVPSGQAEPRIIDVRRTPGRSVMLEYSSRGGYETVELAAYQHPGLDRDELEIATAIVQAAAVVLRLVRAQRDAATDELTGCLNRRAMLERLEDETARSQREHAPLAALMLDVDNLKQINDTFGHLEGDRVLRELGEKLRAQLRRYDVAARYGRGLARPRIRPSVRRRDRRHRPLQVGQRSLRPRRRGSRALRDRRPAQRSLPKRRLRRTLGRGGVHRSVAGCGARGRRRRGRSAS